MTDMQDITSIEWEGFGHFTFLECEEHIEAIRPERYTYNFKINGKPYHQYPWGTKWSKTSWNKLWTFEVVAPKLEQPKPTIWQKLLSRLSL